MSNWTRAQTLALITLYEQNPNLYNVQAEEFLDRIKKTSTVDSICQALKALRPACTSEEVKAKIKTLRNHFIREKNAVAKSKKSGAARDDIYVPRLWYFEELKLNHTSSTPQMSNIPQPSNESLLDKSHSVDNDVYVPGNDCSTRKKGCSAIDKQISRQLKVAEDMAATIREKQTAKVSPQYKLGKIVEMELDGIPEDLFLEAKWKIMDILKETQEKHFFRSKASSSNIDQPPKLYVESEKSQSLYTSSSPPPLKSTKTKLISIRSAPYRQFNTQTEHSNKLQGSSESVMSPPILLDQILTQQSSEVIFQPIKSSSPILEAKRFDIKTEKPRILKVCTMFPQNNSSNNSNEGFVYFNK